MSYARITLLSAEGKCLRVGGRHARQVADPYLKSQWSKAKRAVQEEFGTVKEIEEIKSGLLFGPPGAGIQAKRVVRAHQDVPVEVLTPSDRRAHSFDDQPSVSASLLWCTRACRIDPPAPL